MKKIIIILLIMLILFANIKETSGKKEELKGVFISYIELNNYLKEKSDEEIKNNIKQMIKNTEKLKLNTIFLQVRSQADAIYNSKIYPFSFYTNEEEKMPFDILEYFIEESHKKNIKVYAWINPYRIRTNSNIDSITQNNPAYQYINSDYIYVNNGIYFNPSKKEVEDLIVNGVKEVLRYQVDGVLFDDYFYPNNEIDYKDYEEYIKNNNYIDKDIYNLSVVNRMIKRVHQECKSKNVLFWYIT